MNSYVLQTKECARALNDLARHQQIVKLEQDILMDMRICEIEGWDRMEYIGMLQELINSFARRIG